MAQGAEHQTVVHRWGGAAAEPVDTSIPSYGCAIVVGMSEFSAVAMLRTLPPGPELFAGLVALGAISRRTADAAGRHEVIPDSADQVVVAQMWQQLQSAVEAHLTGAVLQIAGSRVGQEDEDWGREEVAAGLRWSNMATADRIKVGRALNGRCVLTRRALEDGRITYRHAVEIVHALAPLADDLAADVQARLLDAATTRTPAQLAARARREVAKADPAGAEKRHRKARAGRRVDFVPLPDAMAELCAVLPADQATRVRAAIGEWAGRMRTGSDTRTLDQRRADALTALVEVGAFTASGVLPDVTGLLDAAARPARSAARTTPDRTGGPAAPAPSSPGAEDAFAPGPLDGSTNARSASPAPADGPAGSRASAHTASPACTADRAYTPDQAQGIGPAYDMTMAHNLDTAHDEGPAGTADAADAVAPAAAADAADPVGASGPPGPADSSGPANAASAAGLVDAAGAADVVECARGRAGGGESGRAHGGEPARERAVRLVRTLLAGKRAVPARIALTAPLSTVLGSGNAPGDLTGYGPVPACVVRELAGESRWEKWLTDGGGVVTDLGRGTYRPTARLAALVRAAYPTCVFPGCSQPAHRCDLDHTVRRIDGGDTSTANLLPLCRRHHRAKDEGGWGLVHERATGSCVWTSPAGHSYTVQAPDQSDGNTQPAAAPYAWARSLRRETAGTQAGSAAGTDSPPAGANGRPPF